MTYQSGTEPQLSEGHKVMSRSKTRARTPSPRLLIVAILLLASILPTLRADANGEGTKTMDAKFAVPVMFTSAVWDGTSAYIFGGDTQNLESTAIFRYDPSTDALSLATSMPARRYQTSAIWDPRPAPPI